VNRVIFGEEYRVWSSSLYSLLHSHATLFLLGSNILLSTLFLNTFSLYFSLQFLTQIKQTDKFSSVNNSLYIFG
jgi:hypothetical protein